MAIEYLEKRKGCLVTLRLLNARGEMTIREIMRESSLSQNGAYSSLDHLTKLGLTERERLPSPVHRGSPRRYKLTEEGEELLLPLSIFFDSLEYVFRKGDTDLFLMTRSRSLEVLVKIFRKGHACITELVEDEGICKSTAHSALQNLANLGLLRMRVRKDFRMTRKEYSLSEKGQYLGRLLNMVDDKMSLLVKRDHI